MSTNTNIYNHQDVLKMTREGMENSLRFFMTMNENLFKMQDLQRQALNDTTTRSLETFNKWCEEYKTNTQNIVTQIQNTCNTIVDQTVKATERNA